MTTIRFAKGRLVAMLMAGFAAMPALAAPVVEVFKSPYCGCCEKWVEHMKASGFDIVARNVGDLGAARKALGMPERFGSCHTARVEGYVVEGHVPAADVHRLLREKPRAVGLAAPGMPQGSPGMETARPQAYATLLVQNDGSATVFARH